LALPAVLALASCGGRENYCPTDIPDDYTLTMWFPNVPRESRGPAGGGTDLSARICLGDTCGDFPVHPDGSPNTDSLNTAVGFPAEKPTPAGVPLRVSLKRTSTGADVLPELRLDSLPTATAGRCPTNKIIDVTVDGATIRAGRPPELLPTPPATSPSPGRP